MTTGDRKISRIFFLMLSIIPICTNVGVAALVIKKRQLQRFRFYIIANLSMVDSLTLLLLCLGAIKGLHEDINFDENVESPVNLTARIIATSAYINSFFTTVFLSFDRYVAVRWSLQYETILTKVRVILVLCFIWLCQFYYLEFGGLTSKPMLTTTCTYNIVIFKCYDIDFHSECVKIYKCCQETTHDQYTEEIKLFRNCKGKIWQTKIS